MLFTLFFLLCIFPYLLGRLGNRWWLADLFSHWQWQYFIVSGAFLVLWIVGKFFDLVSWWEVNAILLWTVFLGWGYLKYPRPEPAKRADIYFMNMFYTNPDITPIVEDMVTQKPSIIAVVEMTSWFREMITQRGYQEIMSLENKYDSQGIFIREELWWEIEFSKIENIFPYPIGHIVWRGWYIFVIHPYPGILGGMASNQRLAFEQIQERVKKLWNKPFMILGDYNSSIFSPIFQHYFRDYHTPLFYTWNRGKIWQLPIDHAVSNRELQISVRPQMTSDHRGVVVEISWN